MERGGAEAALQNTPDGTFLIRKSTSHSGFSLSVKYREIRHVLILFSRNKYGFSEPTIFDSLPDLIAHFQKNTLADYNAELETKLVHPFKTAPQQSSWASDDTGYDEPDEELYMTNRDALRKSLERQQATELRRNDLYSSRCIELRRKLKAQEAVTAMLREQKALHESFHASCSDAERPAVMANYSELQARVVRAEAEIGALTRDLADETRREREAENQAMAAAAAAPAAAGCTADGEPFVEASPYYVGLISREKAMEMLEGKADGTFLVRRSDRDTDPFTMTLRYKKETKHIQLKSSRNQDGVMHYGLADPPPFSKLDELVAYYKTQKLSATIATTLIRPVKQA